jgi:hypothetical protein
MEPTGRVASLVVTVPFVIGIARAAEPCSIAHPGSPEEVVQGADAIVRATAVE